MKPRKKSTRLDALEILWMNPYIQLLSSPADPRVAPSTLSASLALSSMGNPLPTEYTLDWTLCSYIPEVKCPPRSTRSGSLVTTSKAFVVCEEDEEDILMWNVLQPFVTSGAFEKDRKSAFVTGCKGRAAVLEMSQRAIWSMCEENLFHLKRTCKSSSLDVSYRSVRERGGWEKRKDCPRSSVTSERATADDLEIERASKCVSNSVLRGTWLRQLFTLSVACLRTGRRNWVEFPCMFFRRGPN